MAKIAKRRGRYTLDYYDNTGKRVRKTLKKDTSLKTAKEALRDIEDKLSRGTYIAQSKVPLFSTVAENWLEYKRPNIRTSTWSTYQGYLRNHFHDLDPIKINLISTVDLEKFVSNRRNDPKMHIKTLRRLLMTVGQIMSYAVRHKYIQSNPVRDMEKIKSQGHEIKKVIRFLSPVEVKALFDAEKDLKYKTLFMLAVFSGARQGELLGSQWSDLHLEESQLHIQRSYNNKAWYSTKNESSKRKIDLGPAMMTALKRWKIACPSSELDLIFPNKAGHPMNHDNMMRRHFKPALKRANLGDLRFHDLRHTFASLLIDQGEGLLYIAAQLGHSKPTTTLNIYGHLLRPQNQESAQRLENSVFAPTGHNPVTKSKIG